MRLGCWLWRLRLRLRSLLRVCCLKIKVDGRIGCHDRSYYIVNLVKSAGGAAAQPVHSYDVVAIGIDAIDRPILGVTI